MNSDPGYVSQITTGLSRMAAFLREEQWRNAETLGLTPTQIAILTYLKRRGASRGQSIARQLGVRQPTVSDATEALLRKGLAGKQADPLDRRAVLVALTAEGEALAARLDRAPEALEAALAQLDDGARAGLARQLSSVIRELQESGAIEPQRLCVTCAFFRPHAHKDAAKPHHCAFVDAAFGDAALRLDCDDHDEAESAAKTANWKRFSRKLPA